jgi:hypothetical protein
MPATKDTNVFNKLEEFESKHRAFFNLILKPILTIMIFLSVGYYTMWLSSNYVETNRFEKFLENSKIEDEKTEQFLKSRFELTQTKLETIINQQVAYTEQLKAYNQLLSTFQKQVDSLDQRIMYLERRNNTNN